jgi:phosphoribosylglycinamide formyltransferase-1
MNPEDLRARVREICLAFPGATELSEHPDHSAFLVNKKKFAYFLNNHHGDGVIGVTCKALPGVQGALIDLDRERFYLPAYMHQHGWIGMRLDLEPVDWAQAAQLLREAYLALAPKRLAAALHPA